MSAKLKVLPKPLHDYILGRMILHNETTGGIALPDGIVADDFNRMEVVAVGPGRTNHYGQREEIDVAVGDLVLCLVRDARLPPIQFECKGQTYCLITARELIATVPQGAE